MKTFQFHLLLLLLSWLAKIKQNRIVLIYALPPYKWVLYSICILYIRFYLYYFVHKAHICSDFFLKWLLEVFTIINAYDVFAVYISLMRAVKMATALTFHSKTLIRINELLFSKMYTRSSSAFAFTFFPLLTQNGTPHHPTTHTNTLSLLRMPIIHLFAYAFLRAFNIK